MLILRSLAVSATLLLAFTTAAFAADPTPETIDRLFAPWDRPDTPGAALAIVRDGKIIYSRGYGMANLEYAVPITPATPFHAASVSKQFTAFSIQLLAQEGKLSLDDPVRKHVPELSVDAPITVRHLIHHTSGMRDSWDLLTLAGLRLDDVITENDILGMMWQQKQLNFAPGEEELYSNGGYSLLALIVRRVSGKSLAAFAQERIFGPLGMKNTHFQENYGTLVKGRAYSYRRGREGGYTYVALSYSNTGATSLFTTVEDLALWNANFDHARVGGPAVVAAVLASGKLNNGRETGYASGVVVAPYRGVPAVGHSGADAGYRAFFQRLPQQNLAVLLLGNASDINAVEMARKVSDLYLDGEAGVTPPRTFPNELEMQPGELAAYAGDYQARPGGIVSLLSEGGRLVAVANGQRTVLFPSGANEFFAKSSSLVISFPNVVGNEPATTALWKFGERELSLKRVVRETPGAEMLQACTGDYYSDELRTLYSLSMRDGKLLVRYPRGVLELRPINRDIFVASYPMGVITMKRDAQGKCQELAVTTGRVRNLKFSRTSVN